MTVVSNGGLWFSGTYIPFTCDITNISNGQTTVVTTAVDHGFVVGNTVQFNIPKQWGERQLDGMKGTVLALTVNTITVNIDSLQFDSFSTPVVALPTVIDPAQVLPVGDYNTGYIAIDITNPPLQIPGTYRNTYP
jgi:hypothetical protein